MFAETGKYVWLNRDDGVGTKEFYTACRHDTQPDNTPHNNYLHGALLAKNKYSTKYTSGTLGVSICAPSSSFKNVCEREREKERERPRHYACTLIQYQNVESASFSQLVLPFIRRFIDSYTFKLL